ncbi:biopolymer transporter ExbD [uncultured Bacteroides sp.]|uniref:ExbD/TolR family protein n=1 Tax=uncultured Bacteroides sp. TaxID=162156 RepID=UPI0025F6F50E|nr:biopolymer transporter ExbD [uncultured Bacteroides sp.]
MAKGKRKCPEVNSSSTADIAFLLLIFFLITTSMDTDRGLARRLPPPPETEDHKDDSDKVKERNVMTVFLNMNDQLMANGEYVNVDQLRTMAKEFIANPYNDESKPEKHTKEIQFFGAVQVTEKHVVSLRCDRTSSYKAYLAVQNELVAAYNELRDELAQEKWGKDYAALDEDQQKAVREIYPQKISEAEPKKYGEKK